MKGKRVYPDESENMPLQPGDYGRLEGSWWGRPPVGGASPLASNKVIEHDNGSISIEGLIQLPKWTGFLIRGEWITRAYEPPRSWRGHEGGPDCG